jgi:tetratricopeptide (TPR) repeat protein
MGPEEEQTDNGHPAPELSELKDLGTRQLRRGRLKKARATFEHVLKRDAKDVYALVKLGSVLAQQYEYDRAEWCLRRALGLDRNNLSALNNLGNVFLERGRLREAIECYEAAIRIDEHYVQAYHNLAVAYKKDGDIANYLDVLRRSNRLRVQDSRRRHGLLELLGIRKKRTDE